MSDISIEETSIVTFGVFGVFVLELLEFLGLLFLFYYFTILLSNGWVGMFTWI